MHRIGSHVHALHSPRSGAPRTPSRTRALAAATLLLVAAATTRARAQDVARAVRTDAAPRLDGRLDDAVWSEAPPLVATVSQPSFGAGTPRTTIFRLAYDGRFVYAAGQFEGAPPSARRANALQRDRLGSDDIFRVIIDSYADQENALGFATTPTGVRTDFAITRDAQSISNDWNGFWDVAVATTDSSWTAEMRIPLSTLRYRSVDGRVTMGIILSRVASAANEVQTFPAISPQFANAAFRPSRASALVLDGVDSHRPAYLAPYALVGSDGRAGAPGTPFHEQGRVDAGADAKIGLSSSLTLDVTANTDFAQAEADDEQVNLTRFSLFFPEKRQFFQESAGVFEFNTGLGEPSRLFHSRRIGLTDAGDPIRLRAGARLVGRVGAVEVGALDIIADAPQGGTENLGVMRLRWQSRDTRRTLGVITTSRTGGEVDNHAVGFDATVRQGTNDFGTFQWARTFDAARSTAAWHADMLRASWERRASQGLVYRLGMRYVGRDHAPGLGFQNRLDFTQLEGNLRYGWYPGAGARFEFIQPSFLFNVVRHNTRERIETGRVTQYLNFGTKSGIGGNINLTGAYEDLPAALPLSPEVSVPAGTHRWGGMGVSVGTPPGRPLRVNVSGNVGRFYDGTQRVASLAPTWVASRHLELGADYQWNRLDFGQRGAVQADLARLRVQTAVSPSLSLNAFVQYNRLSESVGGNVRVRWHLAEGRDLFLVYNERLNVDRPEDVGMPYRQSRSVLAKMTYTLSR